MVLDMVGLLGDFWTWFDALPVVLQWAGAACAVTTAVMVVSWAWRFVWLVVLLAWNVLLIGFAVLRWLYWVFIGVLGRAVNSSDGVYRMVDGRRVVAKNVPLVRFSFTRGRKHVIPVPELSLNKQLALRTRKEWNRMRNTVAPIVLARDEWYCQWCDTGLNEENWSIDHIIPISKGGTNDMTNLQAMCRPCNSMKGTKSDSWGKFWDRVAA
jgi:hypothetical protein